MPAKTTGVIVYSEDFESVRLDVPAGTGCAQYWAQRILMLNLPWMLLVKWGEMNDPAPFSQVGLRGATAGERTAA